MIKRKLKVCIDCGNDSIYFGFKRCKTCYLKYKNYKINPVSKKEESRKRKYLRLRGLYLEKFPICEVCNKAHATTIHHKKGREGENLFNFFLAACISCHREIEMNPTWAYENNYSIPRGE